MWEEEGGDDGLEVGCLLRSLWTWEGVNGMEVIDSECLQDRGGILRFGVWKVV